MGQSMLYPLSSLITKSHVTYRSLFSLLIYCPVHSYSFHCFSLSQIPPRKNVGQNIIQLLLGQGICQQDAHQSHYFDGDRDHHIAHLIFRMLFLRRHTYTPVLPVYRWRISPGLCTINTPGPRSSG